MQRLLPVFLVAAGLSWVSPAPAGDPEVPERYIKVAEVRALLDQKKPVTLIDVRDKEQYDELHIRGARNIPLQELPRRLAEVSKQDFVVLY